MELHCKILGLSGWRATIAVDEGATLQHLKDGIQAALQVRPWQQRLVYGTLELRLGDGDERLQGLVGIEPGATVELLLVVRPEDEMLSPEEVLRAFEVQYDVNLPEIFEVSDEAGTCARERTSGRLVVKKEWATRGAFELQYDEENRREAMREVSLLKQLKHVNVTELLDVFCSTRNMIWVCEHHGDHLRQYMRNRDGVPLDPATIKSLSFQLCRGIEFCHAKNVLHLELSLRTLRIDGRGCLKISNFSSACTLSTEHNFERIACWYRPLENLLGSRHYGFPADTWGVGCLHAEIATNDPLFQGDSQIDTIFKICKKLGTPTPNTLPGLADLPYFKLTFPKWDAMGWDNIGNTRAQLGAVGVDLLEQYMVYDPRKRISARRALQHPYFVDVVLPDGV